MTHYKKTQDFPKLIINKKKIKKLKKKKVGPLQLEEGSLLNITRSHLSILTALIVTRSRSTELYLNWFEIYLQIVRQQLSHWSSLYSFCLNT